MRVQSSELPISILGSPLHRMYCSAMAPANLACLHLLATASARLAGGAAPHGLVCVINATPLRGGSAIPSLSTPFLMRAAHQKGAS